MKLQQQLFVIGRSQQQELSIVATSRARARYASKGNATRIAEKNKPKNLYIKRNALKQQQQSRRQKTFWYDEEVRLHRHGENCQHNVLGIQFKHRLCFYGRSNCYEYSLQPIEKTEVEYLAMKHSAVPIRFICKAKNASFKPYMQPIRIIIFLLSSYNLIMYERTAQ